MKQVIEFKAPKREFILHNCTIDRVELMYGGETKWLPPCDRTTAATPGNPHSFASGKDADGDVIPGSLVFTDLYDTDPTSGVEISVWNAWDAVKALLGVDPLTGIATGPYAQRGISLIPPQTSKEEIANIAAAARIRFRQFSIEQARSIVAGHDADNSRRKRHGNSEVPGDSKYEEALNILETARRGEKERVNRLMGDGPLQTVAPDSGQAASLPDPDEEGLVEFLRDRVMEMAAETNVSDRHALVDKFLGDPENMKVIKARYKMKKWRDVEKAQKVVEAS